MSETPEYVLGAVRAFIDEDRREPLVNQFQNGIPLHSYPESRELIEKLLRGKAIRPAGRKSGAGIQARNIGVQNEVARLVAEGLPLFSSGESRAPTACSIVGEWYGLSAKQVKRIVTKAKDTPGH